MQERYVNNSSLTNEDGTEKRSRDRLEQQLRDFQDIIDVKTTSDREIEFDKNLPDTEDTR